MSPRTDQPTRRLKRARRPRVRVDVIRNPDHVESHDLPDDPIAARCAAALLCCFPRYRARFLMNDIVAHTWEADTEAEAENGLWQSIEREARDSRGVDFRAFARDLK